MWIDLPLAFFPSSSSPTCTFQIRDTSPNRSSGSRWTWRERNICARPRWCCTSTEERRRASNRTSRRLARSRRQSPDPSPRSRWTCRRRRRTCTRSDTCPSLYCNGTTVPLDSLVLPAFLRNIPDAPTGPTWQPTSVCRRCCRKRRLCCLTHPEEAYARKVNSHAAILSQTCNLEYLFIQFSCNFILKYSAKLNFDSLAAKSLFFYFYFLP